MDRKKEIEDKVAILATGDEVCNGDILNSNSKEIAQRLFDHGMQIGMHMVTSDHISEIEAALKFLLNSHRAVIITGGLGPTSDDLTRYAVSRTLGRSLEFDEKTWANISERLLRLGYPSPPESNRQQALFPDGATIIPNQHGTAAGCQLRHHDQWIFMLPGPPSECLPMVENEVISTLKQADFEHTLYRQSWMLFGVSEGQIAEELDKLAEPFQCTTGYRLFYPYLEFKLYSNTEEDFIALSSIISDKIKPYLISDGKNTASETLRNLLNKTDLEIGITDLATTGALENTLKTPDNFMNLHFSTEATFPLTTPYFIIKGLQEYWQGKTEANNTHLEITFVHNEKTETVRQQIPLRGHRVKLYAVEFISHHIYQFIHKNLNL